MKMSVQMPPLGAKDNQTVRLQTRAGADWKTIAEAPIHPEARVAAFRVASWDAAKDTAYRLARALHRGEPMMAAKLPQGHETTAANTAAGAPRPELIHPGARRYFREIGLLP